MGGHDFVTVGDYTHNATGRTFTIKWDRAGGKVYVGQWRTGQTVGEGEAYDAGKALIHSNDRK